jgi:hypothetical protein
MVVGGDVKGPSASTPSRRSSLNDGRCPPPQRAGYLREIDWFKTKWVQVAAAPFKTGVHVRVGQTSRRERRVRS